MAFLSFPFKSNRALHVSPLRPGKTASKRVLAGPAIVLLAALAATAPQILRGASCGHDFDFHLVSWLDALQSWRHGLFYPHWAPSPNLGAGEPRFVFYPPLTWMLGAAIGLVLPWAAVSTTLTFLMLAGAGLATRALARQVLREEAAILAGCAAIFSGYTIFTVYERSAFGELTGSFWLPLLLLLLLRERNPASALCRRALDGSAALLALVVAGAWLSDAPLGVMASYLLAGIALVAAGLRRTWAPVMRASIAVVLGLGLAAIYLVPAAVEQHWVAIRQTTDDPGYLIENSWLFARHSNPALEFHDAELLKVSFIAVTMIAVALCGLLGSWTSISPANRSRWWIPLGLIPLVVFVLQLPISLPIWNLLPKLRYLQFPWRWLVALEAPMGILFAGAAWRAPRRVRFALIATFCGIALLMTGAATTRTIFFQICDEDDAVRGMLDAYHAGTGFEGTDEYAPPDTDSSLLALNLPLACLNSSPSTALGEGPGGVPPEWSPDQGTCEATYSAAPSPGNAATEHLRIRAVTPHPGYLILRLRRYPAWQVRVNGELLQTLPDRTDGLLAVPVPQGDVHLTVDWITTPDVVAGRWLSLLALMLLISLWLIERRLAAPQLS